MAGRVFLKRNVIQIFLEPSEVGSAHAALDRYRDRVAPLREDITNKQTPGSLQKQQQFLGLTGYTVFV